MATTEERLSAAESRIQRLGEAETADQLRDDLQRRQIGNLNSRLIFLEDGLGRPDFRQSHPFPTK